MRIEVTSELMHEDSPHPWRPRMSTWGISARLTKHGAAGDVAPSGHLERVDGRVGLVGGEDVARETSWRWRFGTSTPMADFPGMGARMRTSGDAIA